MKRFMFVAVMFTLLMAVALSCSSGGGGGTPGISTFTVGGTVSGLNGSGLVLQNNGADDLAGLTNGAFTFATSVADGGAYNVTVMTHPANPNQTCTASNNAGTISGAHVSDVSVVCSTNSYSVGGSVTGLAGSGLVLQDNAGDDLAVSSSGTFIFATRIADGAGYSVTVKTQPSSPNQTCTASTNTGTVAGADVTNVSVVCSTISYSVGGTVSSLAGTGLVLQNNGANDLTIATNGTFTFTTPVADTAGYAVTVRTQPTANPGRTCMVNSGSGTLAGANVTNVSIICSVNTFPVGGTVSGLTGTGLTLQNNNADDLVLSSNGTFSFPAKVTDGAGYNVTIKTQPGPDQMCMVNSGSGTVPAANVTNVTIWCSEKGLPKTGQTATYAARDDGSLQKGVAWPSLRFIDNTDGTITDKLTGLMWLQSAATSTVSGSSLCSSGTKTWQGALNYTACLNANAYLGHDDWRLPNSRELKSLFDKSSYNPALPAGHPFTGVQSSSYWSSTTAAYNTSVAYVLTTYDGIVGMTDKTTTAYAWPVRYGANTPALLLPKTGQKTSYDANTVKADDGALQKGVEWPNPRFTDNGDGTITDNLTGLMWLKDANCGMTYDLDGTGFGNVSWLHALQLVSGVYTVCGDTDGKYTDWRLPNDIELESLADYAVYNPDLPTGHPFTSVQSGSYYWTSTTSSSTTGNAWMVSLYYGHVTNSAKTGFHSVWPVRGGR